MVGNVARAAIIGDRRITGLPAAVIAELVAEVGPLWQMHERRRKAHSSRRIRVEHGIAHLKNWRH
ncbi:hypothetical protein ABT025_38885 [Streptomyces sp. NPDC002809]|uniref:hypothetical protein n=1 Tax=Streptomyces sp. NPDC002809 TaxID=3154433 RepID=UPI00331A9AD2